MVIYKFRTIFITVPWVQNTAVFDQALLYALLCFSMFVWISGVDKRVIEVSTVFLPLASLNGAFHNTALLNCGCQNQ